MKKILFLLLIVFAGCKTPVSIENKVVYSGLSYQSNINGGGFKLAVMPDRFTAVGSNQLKGVAQNVILDLQKGIMIYDEDVAGMCYVAFSCCATSPNNNSVFLGCIYKNSEPLDITAREDEDMFNKAISISSSGLLFLKKGDTVSFRIQIPTGAGECSIKNYNLTLQKIN